MTCICLQVGLWSISVLISQPVRSTGRPVYLACDFAPRCKYSCVDARLQVNNNFDMGALPHMRLGVNAACLFKFQQCPRLVAVDGDDDVQMTSWSVKSPHPGRDSDLDAARAARAAEEHAVRVKKEGKDDGSDSSDGGAANDADTKGTAMGAADTQADAAARAEKRRKREEKKKLAARATLDTEACFLSSSSEDEDAAAAAAGRF